jgi:hypothetical protein
VLGIGITSAGSSSRPPHAIQFREQLKRVPVTRHEFSSPRHVIRFGRTLQAREQGFISFRCVVRAREIHSLLDRHQECVQFVGG